MAEKYVMINDIIEDHNARMHNLKKYYPFFLLTANTFSMYKEGKYLNLDMGYIIMASIRFMINENNFNEKDVTYEEYEDFLLELLHRDFLVEDSKEEEHELVGYIFDKLKNDGKAFEFRFFDPSDKKTKASRVKLIESRISNGQVFYHITADAIEFYLDTKEIKDESTISVQQLLLEKMINSKNFKGGIEVVKRINGEVSKLILEKENVINLLSYDVFSGAKACEDYMNTVARWFSDEQKLFIKNKELIDKALKMANDSTTNYEEAASKIKSLSDISKLEIELKKTIARHNELIDETVDLQNISDSIINRAKLRKLRPVFDFRGFMGKLDKADEPDMMSHVLMPLFKPNIKKSFNMNAIDELLTYRQDNKESGEKIVKEDIVRDFKYEDQIEDERIAANYVKMFTEIMNQVNKKNTISLKELNAIFEIKFGDEIFRNGDFYSFLVHLSGKKTYVISTLKNKQDTFLEGIIAVNLDEDSFDKYKNMTITLDFGDLEVIDIAPGFSVTNIQFGRR